VLRDRAVGTMEPFLLTMGELNSYVCADIELVEALNIVDLTGDGRLRLRTPTDVTGAMDQTLARVWSEAFFRHPDGTDGVIYPSRLNGERNIALYDRALGKVAVRAAPRLIERRDELAAIIVDFNLAIAGAWQRDSNRKRSQSPVRAGESHPMAKPPTKPPGPPRGGSGIKPPAKKSPVNTSPPVRSAAGVGLKTPTALTLVQRRSLAASEERHIEPRTAPKGEPKKPATSQKVKTEGGKELNNPKALQPKQVQSLAGSVMAHIPRAKQPATRPPPAKPPTPKPPGKPSTKKR